MLLMPQPDTAFVDPFTEIPTLCMICNVQDPITREDYSRDPRNVARKAVNYLKSTGVADTCFIGPEAEFFIFDDVRFDQTPNAGYFFLDSEEGQWNRGRDYRAEGMGPNLGYKLRHKEGYFPVPPADSLMDIRNEMMLTMIECGTGRRGPAPRSGHRRPVGNRPEVLPTWSKMGDAMCLYKYIIKNVAKKYGKTVTFMPKPLFSDNGSGMHTHISFWKGGQPLFAGNGYAGLSEAGLVRHRRHPQARPGHPGLHQPHHQQLQAVGAGLRSAGQPGLLAAKPLGLAAAFRCTARARRPSGSSSAAPTRAAIRTWRFATLMMAALDGIQNKIHPGEPLDKDIYDLAPEELAEVPKTPGSLAESLDALAKDHEFLLRGDVFTEDVIHTWISYKRKNEVEALALRPHPYEFCLYYDM